MIAMPKTGSRFNIVLLQIDARRFRENNQQKCIDCLKPSSNKNEPDCRKCGYNELYVFNYPNF